MWGGEKTPRLHLAATAERDGRGGRTRSDPSSLPPQPRHGRVGRGPQPERDRLHLRRRSAPAGAGGCERPGRGDESLLEECSSDPETGVVPGVTRDRNTRSRSRCSMCPAIHINSRSWLRSSSTHEPSDPPLRVIYLSAPRRGGKKRLGRPAGATTDRRPGEGGVTPPPRDCQKRR